MWRSGKRASARDVPGRPASAQHLYQGQWLDIDLLDVPAQHTTDSAPAPRPPRRVTPRSAHAVRIPPEQWPLVAADARALGLRGAARRHGISHETVRQIARRLVVGAPLAAAGEAGASCRRPLATDAV